MPRSTSIRLGAASLIALAFAAPASAQQPIKLRVAGNLVATGLIQQKKEQPFFENMAKITGLPGRGRLQAAGRSRREGRGRAAGAQVRAVRHRLPAHRAGLARRAVLARRRLVGLNPDYKVARKVVDAYREAFDKRLQERHGGEAARHLAVRPAGRVLQGADHRASPISRAGKSGYTTQSLAKFIEKLGGIPVTIPFAETQQALERGVTDCAITGPSSANTAGWPEVTTHFMPIGFQIALNAYGMNLNKWNSLGARSAGEVHAMPSRSSRTRSGLTQSRSSMTRFAATSARSLARPSRSSR